MRLRHLITSVSSSVVTWAGQWTHAFGGSVSIAGALATAGAVQLGSLQAAAISGAGQTVIPTAPVAILLITAATNDNFTLALPSGSFGVGQRIVVIVANASGGAMGTMTPAAGYFFSAFTSPGNGARRVVEFAFDGTAWNQVSLSAADLT